MIKERGEIMKKAILVISFGTSHLDTIEKTIDKVEGKIAETFKEYDVFRAFTSHMIIRALDKKYGIKINKPEEVLDNLYREGYKEIVIQPLHIISGEEFDYIKNVVRIYKQNFEILRLSRPLLYFENEEEKDYTSFINALDTFLPKSEGYVLVGHGTLHPSFATYGCLQNILSENDKENFLIGTIEGYPSVDNVIKRLRRLNIKDITLVPFLLVAGDHAKNDIAGDDEDSWKSILKANGFNVNVFLHGLGEFEAIWDMYINHLRETIDGKVLGKGETKKGAKVLCTQ